MLEPEFDTKEEDGKVRPLFPPSHPREKTVELNVELLCEIHGNPMEIPESFQEIELNPLKLRLFRKKHFSLALFIQHRDGKWTMNASTSHCQVNRWRWIDLDEARKNKVNCSVFY